ncbi:MAG: Gldg family protein [Verrucomicrobia bacterium]|nr:Gldg family protein [Verrucomicrobiota bacterium]
MNQKKTETLLYSALGVAFMFLVILGVNLIVSALRGARVDMTADRLYTLSDGTRKILRGIDSPIEVRFYCSQGEKQMPAQLKSFAKSVEDLLEEFRQQNPGNIEIRKFNPAPDSEAEDLARLDGIEPRNLPTGEAFYMGVAVSLDPVKVALPYLAPERERQLEYDLARVISRVVSTNKPVVGLMTTLPMSGMPANPAMMRMGQRGQEPWVVYNELKRDFTVESVGMDVESIPDNIRVLLVIHPKEISEKAQFAIDQFILRGGKLIAFVDPLCLVDSSNPGPMGISMGNGSSLPKLIKAWGLDFESGKVVADLSFMKSDLAGGDGRRRIEPTWLFLNPKGIDRNDAIISQFDNILMPSAGAFTGTPVTGLKLESLLHSTTNSQTVDTFMAQGGGQKIVTDFSPSGKEMALAVRITGKFKTAFPEGKPADPKSDDKDEDAKKEEPAREDLKESKAENVVYLIGDADMLFDNFSVRKLPFFGIAQPFNGNLAFVQSITEQMAGDSNLIGARSRASIRRPFTVVEDMRAEAQKRYQDRISGFEKEVQEAQQKISEIQSKKEGNQRFILSPEAQAELAKLQQKQTDANRALREERKKLRRDEESLQNRLKWANIAGMPIIVSIAGVVLAFIRRRKSAAR